MLTLTAPLALALVPARSASDSIERDRSILFEIYSTNYYPDVNGLFDPSDAIARWAKHDCIWLGELYESRILSHGGLSEFISGQFNSISVTINNADRYLQQFAATNVLDGLRLVIRYVNWDHSAALADSRQWVLRLQAPDNSELDREQGDLTAREELATLDCEIPKRRIAPEDPEGRSPNDPLWEGFGFNARPSTVRVMSDPEYHTKWLIFRRRKETVAHAQWAAQGGAADAVLRLFLGRAQVEGQPAFWTDIGFYIIGIWVYSGHKITSITNFMLPDTSHIFYGPWADEALKQAHVHLGDPGGTGTNATPDDIENNYPQNTALLSRSGYVGFAIGGPESESQPFANPQMDAVPTLVAIVLSEMGLPNGSGVFNQRGFSDSPVYAAREVFTSEDYFGLDPLLVNDTNLPAVHAERQRPIIDKSNGEFLALMEHDLSSLVAGDITRLSSTGLIDSRYFRHLLDSAQPDPLVTNRTDAFAVSVGGENPGGGDQLLTDGVTLAGQSVTAPAFKYYYIDVPVGATQLQVVGTGAGDAALYTRHNSKPTPTVYDCLDYTASPQSCIHDNPTSGRWWIGVEGRTGTTTFTIIAIVVEGMTGNVLPAKAVVRKAWTTNLPLTDTTNAADFLQLVLATGRLYRVTDTAGRQDIRAKKASDSTYLISDAAGGTAATGTITIDTLPADADTVTVNGINFIFRTTPNLGSEIAIGANVNASVTSLVLALTTSLDGLLANANYVNSGSGVLTITHDDGVAGNSFTLAKVSTHITLSGATLSGGLDGDAFVLVANVEAWRASQRGYLLINPGLVTSEYRTITSAQYHPATGDSITLEVSGTGLTVSGATLAGGSTSAPSEGEVTVSSASGDLVVTVWDIPITYTVLANDIDESVAGMLATLINADPNLNQYVRAEWEEDDIVHIYSTVGKLIFASALVHAHESQVDSPVTGPTAVAVASGTLAPGSYYLGYSLVDGSGSETLMSPLTKIVIATGQKVSVTSLGVLPTGAAEVNWYFSPAPNDDHVQFLITNAGGTLTIDDVADYDADYPSTVNQTGGETIRVAEVFNRFNIRHGSFKWVPAASKINQVSGEYVDAANGFKRTKVTVNDRAHQRAIKQINKKEINLSGVDNFSQAIRMCHATLAEERDGGAGAKWATDDAGIAFEIGDVVAVNDYRWDGSAIENYLVNQPIFITERTVQEDFDVSFAGKVYSSSLLEGQIGRKPVVVATTLKYLTEAPPVATNLVLAINTSTLSGYIVDFDFGTWAGSQRALVFIAGPSATEPDEEDFQLLDTVLPDALNKGHFEARAATSDKYWIKVVTQSQFGQSAATGHPVEMIDLRPSSPIDFDCLFDEVNDSGLFQWNTNDSRTPLGRESYDLEISVPGDGDFSAVRGVYDNDPNDWSQYVIWALADAVLISATVAGVEPGGFNMTGTGGIGTPQATLNSKQTFLVGRGAEFEFELPTDVAIPTSLGMLSDSVSISIGRLAETSPDTTNGYAIYVTDGIANSQIYTAVVGDRFSIVLRPDSQPQVFLNRLGPASQPLFTSTVVIDKSEVFYLSAIDIEGGAASGLIGGVRNAAISRFTPEWLYLAAAQLEDNSEVLPPTIKARVRQRSFVAGGPPGDWTTGEFTRP